MNYLKIEKLCFTVDENLNEDVKKLRQIYERVKKTLIEMEFQMFLREAEVKLNEPYYDEALKLYIGLDEGDLDFAMERIDKFNDFVDEHSENKNKNV